MDKVKIALERIKLANEMRERLFDTPFYVAYSGGKDSDTVRILFELSNAPYELWHNHTTVDAPETVRYVRSIPGINISYPALSMWRLIEKKKIPPTRLIRYCCKELKETGGTDRFVVTGVRWSESTKRKFQRSGLEVVTKKKSDKLILNSDNAEERQQFENCVKKGKRVFNPIIDWTDADVWEFLNYYGCRSNPLYECGYDRIGCIGCPMARKKRLRDFERYPKYYDAYLNAFDLMLTAREKAGREVVWKTAQDVMDWWLEG